MLVHQLQLLLVPLVIGFPSSVVHSPPQRFRGSGVPFLTACAHVPRVLYPRLQKPSKESLLPLYRMLKKLDTDKIFMYPVSDDDAPLYSKLILSPMTWSQMRKKVDSDAYVEAHHHCPPTTTTLTRTHVLPRDSFPCHDFTPPSFLTKHALESTKIAGWGLSTTNCFWTQVRDSAGHRGGLLPHL